MAPDAPRDFPYTHPPDQCILFARSTTSGPFLYGFRMPAILAEKIARQLAACRAEHEMSQSLTLVVETARSAGYEGEIAELYQQVCDELERQLQRPGDPVQGHRLRLARDLVRRRMAGERA